MKVWTIKSEKEILSADLFKVYDQHLVGPDNIERIYKIVRRRPTVSVIPLTEDNEIYLVGQDRPLLEKFSWALMAGFIDEGESPEEAAQRELKEEIGLEASHWRKLAEIETAASVVKSTSHLYIASTLIEGKSNPDEGEHLTVKKVKLSEAVEDVLEGKINTAISIAGILLADKLIQTKQL